jgi:hypothetical protein
MKPEDVVLSAAIAAIGKWFSKELRFSGFPTRMRHAIAAAINAMPPDPELARIVVPDGLHPRTADLVIRFTQALASKLYVAQEKYGYTDKWADKDWLNECRISLVEHVKKGDPRDVAAYCAFLWHHNESTAMPLDPELASLRAENAALRKDAERYRILRRADNDLLFISEDGRLPRGEKLDAAIDFCRY